MKVIIRSIVFDFLIILSINSCNLSPFLLTNFSRNNINTIRFYNTLLDELDNRFQKKYGIKVELDPNIKNSNLSEEDRIHIQQRINEIINFEHEFEAFSQKKAFSGNSRPQNQFKIYFSKEKTNFKLPNSLFIDIADQSIALWLKQLLESAILVLQASSATLNIPTLSTNISWVKLLGILRFLQYEPQNKICLQITNEENAPDLTNGNCLFVNVSKDSNLPDYSFYIKAHLRFQQILAKSCLSNTASSSNIYFPKTQEYEPIPELLAKLGDHYFQTRFCEHLNHILKPIQKLLIFYDINAEPSYTPPKIRENRYVSGILAINLIEAAYLELDAFIDSIITLIY